MQEKSIPGERLCVIMISQMFCHFSIKEWIRSSNDALSYFSKSICGLVIQLYICTFIYFYFLSRPNTVYVNKWQSARSRTLVECRPTSPHSHKKIHLLSSCLGGSLRVIALKTTYIWMALSPSSGETVSVVQAFYFCVYHVFFLMLWD